MTNNNNKDKGSRGNIIVALIGAFATITAAVIGVIATNCKEEPITIKNIVYNATKEIIAIASPVDKLNRVVRSGDFELRFTTAEIRPLPGYSANSYMQATVGVDITNNGDVPLRIAIIPGWPTLQIEGGVQFDNNGQDITGIEKLNLYDAGRCQTDINNFSLIRPENTVTASMKFQTNLDGRNLSDANFGRLSGTMMVQTSDGNSCTKEPFTAAKIPVKVFK